MCVVTHSAEEPDSGTPHERAFFHVLMAMVIDMSIYVSDNKSVLMSSLMCLCDCVIMYSVCYSLSAIHLLGDDVDQLGQDERQRHGE